MHGHRELELLEDDGDRGTGVGAARLRTSHGHAPCLRTPQPRHHVQQTRLAGAVAADQRDDLASRHVERHLVQHWPASELEPQVADPQRWWTFRDVDDGHARPTSTACTRLSFTPSRSSSRSTLAS